MATQVKKIDSSLTKILLICGTISGPLFIVVVLTQFFTRDGADIHRLPLSLLSLGDLGWIQIANFIITGLLALACAVGIRRVLAGSKSGTWGAATHCHLWTGVDPGWYIPSRSGLWLSSRRICRRVTHNQRPCDGAQHRLFNSSSLIGFCQLCICKGLSFSRMEPMGCLQYINGHCRIGFIGSRFCYLYHYGDHCYECYCFQLGVRNCIETQCIENSFTKSELL